MSIKKFKSYSAAVSREEGAGRGLEKRRRRIEFSLGGDIHGNGGSLSRQYVQKVCPKRPVAAASRSPAIATTATTTIVTAA